MLNAIMIISGQNSEEQGRTNFPKTQDPPQNTWRHVGDMKAISILRAHNNQEPSYKI
jgi:hypothetical protein